MDNQREGERVERATVVYENTRLVLERLYDIDAELEAQVFEKYGVAERAKEQLEAASQALDQLADLMRNMHMRPSEDASDDALSGT